MNKTLPTAFLLATMALAGCAGGSSSPSAGSSAVPSAAPSSAASADPGMTANATLMDFKIELAPLTLTESFTVAVVNNGATPHNFSIRDDAGTTLFASPQLSREQTASVPVTGLAAGEYTYFCSLPGHESLGMKGTLTVN